MGDSDWAHDTPAEAFVHAETSPHLPQLEKLKLDLTPLSDSFDMDELFAPFDDSLHQDAVEHESSLAECEQILKNFELQIASIDDYEKSHQTIPVCNFSTTPKDMDKLAPKILIEPIPKIMLAEYALDQDSGGDGKLAVTHAPKKLKSGFSVSPDHRDGPELQTVRQGNLLVTGRAPRTVSAHLSSTGDRDAHLQGPQHPRQYPARPIPHWPRDMTTDVATNMGTNERGELSPFEVSEK